MKKYYLHNGSEQEGPFDLEELKSKYLTKDTPIWFDQLTDWTTAGQIEELKGIVSSTPPPFTNKSTSPPFIQKPLSQQKLESVKPKKSSSVGRRILTLVGIVVLILVGIFIYNQLYYQRLEDERKNRENAEKNIKETVKNNITSYVTAERNQYQYNELGGIYNLEISVNNNSDYLLDNVKVRVIYIKANGEVWDSRVIDFNLLDPHSKGTIKVPDTDRGTSVKYEITSIKSSALGLN